MMKKLKIIELFSGIGAPKKALNDLKIDNETLFISEIDDGAINAYDLLFPNEKKHNIGDISNINFDEIKKYKNNCDILFFGSPCQDFSIAGNNKGGKKSSGTRSSLLWSAYKIINFIRPKIVVFENVKNLLSKKHVNIVNQYISDMKKINYFNTDPIILNSKNFGIPQNRERVFVVSFLSKGIFESFKEIDWKKKYKDHPTLEEFLEIKDFNKRNLEKQKIEHRNWTNFSTWTAKSGNINGSYNRAWKISSYSGTLNTSTIIKITDDKNVSKLTPEEYWLLMGFKKEDFKKVKNLNENKLYKLAGNSMVVDVMKEIILELKYE